MSDAAANPQTFGATDLVCTLLSTTRKNWLSMFVGGLVVLLLGFLVLLVFGSMSFGSLLVLISMISGVLPTRCLRCRCCVKLALRRCR